MKSILSIMGQIALTLEFHFLVPQVGFFMLVLF